MLEDSATLQASRAQYSSEPQYRNATLPPFVLRGDFIDGQTYWIGELTTQVLTHTRARAHTHTHVHTHACAARARSLTV